MPNTGFAQVTLRMRREVCWLWRERPLQSGAETRASALPPFADPALGALDLARYDRDKQEFFASDVTAAHLSELHCRVPAAMRPRRVAHSAGSYGNSPSRRSNASCWRSL